MATQTQGQSSGEQQMMSGEESAKSERTSKKSGRGFAGMDAERQRQIASEGGRAAHEKGTAHEFTPDEARAAGRKGGEAVSQDRQHMSEIGRKGGEARGGAHRAKVAAQRDEKNESSHDTH